jgi:ArsR family transcriptional regulator
MLTIKRSLRERNAHNKVDGIRKIKIIMAKVKKKISSPGRNKFLNGVKSRCCLDKKLVANLSPTAEFLKIISEKNRLKILCLLKEGEKCVCDIWQCLDLAQNLTSHHLKVLKSSGLLLSRREGLKIIYSINKKIVKKYLELLNKFLSLKV